MALTVDIREFDSAFDDDRPDMILGFAALAAGGQMYGARDLRLLIISLIS
jgi:hypothetical protein